MKAFNVFHGELTESRDQPGSNPVTSSAFARDRRGRTSASEESARVLIFSTKQLPDAAVYPDSGKMGVWSGNDADPGRLFRISSEVDYWDRES